MSKIDDLWAAYHKGQADAERDGIFGQAVHFSAGHAMGAMLSVFGTSDEEVAYEKGYDGDELALCYECERVKENCECDNGSQANESYSSDESYNYGSSDDSSSSGSDYSGSSYSSSDTSTGSSIGPLILIVVVVGGLILLGKVGIDRTKSWANNRSQEVWTMMGVNTTMLNVRSGPGTNSPVIAKFGRGARLATTGAPVINGNEQWVRVSTDDGKVQGWANQKFLSASPQLQEPSAPISNGESEANNQGSEVPGQKGDNGGTGDPASNSSKLSREKCQELIDLSFVQLAVEIPPECDKQLEEHYKKLREKHSGKNGPQKEW